MGLFYPVCLDFATTGFFSCGTSNINITNERACRLQDADSKPSWFSQSGRVKISYYIKPLGYI